MIAAMIKLLRKEVFYLSLLSCFLIALFSYFSLISKGCEGGMDSYNHYLISKFSWQHPKLFLDQWGKPLYNILASPFANFGFFGVKFFNIILWIATAWLTWLTAKKLAFPFAWVGFLLVILPEESIKNTISGLTEYLNAFLLILFMYLAACKRFNFAAGIAGLLPFARSEGFVIMLAVGFYLLFIEKKYKSLIWFFAGPLLFNGLGWLIEGDPIWIIHNPYIKAQITGANLCGSGSLFHYINQSRFIFSFAGTVLLLLGSFLALYYYMKTFKQTNFIHRYMLWLCAGIFWLYFGVHSFIWWKGMMGSCGYSRVMIVISPLMALLSVYALNVLSKKFTAWRNYLMITLIALLLISANHSMRFVSRNMPYDISNEQKEFVKVAEWLKTYDRGDNMVFFLYPYLNILADIDPYDKQHFEFLWSFDFDYSPVGSILIWDGHFGPNECRIPLNKLKDNPDFVLVKSFVPNKPFVTLNDYPFEIHVFKRVKNSNKK